MQKQHLGIENIPAILWGESSDKLFIAVHGNMSNKADDVIVALAEEVVPLGYQVLSFDLPEHGDRTDEGYPCNVQNCVADLKAIMRYAQSISANISLFACSMGAYFSLLAYKHESLAQSLFLSPVVNMQAIIEGMMAWTGVTEERLRVEKEIPTPGGPILYWDYYCYVKDHPVVEWGTPTSILYGSKDDICKFDIVSSFAEEFKCNMEVLENGEHYFHTQEQLEYFRVWLKVRLNSVSL